MTITIVELPARRRGLSSVPVVGDWVTVSASSQWTGALVDGTPGSELASIGYAADWTSIEDAAWPSNCKILRVGDCCTGQVLLRLRYPASKAAALTGQSPLAIFGIGYSPTLLPHYLLDANDDSASLSFGWDDEGDLLSGSWRYTPHQAMRTLGAAYVLFGCASPWGAGVAAIMGSEYIDLQVKAV